MKPRLEIYLPYYHPEWSKMEIEMYDIPLMEGELKIGRADADKCKKLKKMHGEDYNPHAIYADLEEEKLLLPNKYKFVEGLQGIIQSHKTTTSQIINNDNNIFKVFYTHMSEKTNSYVMHEKYNPDNAFKDNFVIILTYNRMSNSHKLENGQFVVFGSKKGPTLRVVNI